MTTRTIRSAKSAATVPPPPAPDAWAIRAPILADQDFIIMTPDPGAAAPKIGDGLALLDPSGESVQAIARAFRVRRVEGSLRIAVDGIHRCAAFPVASCGLTVATVDCTALGWPVFDAAVATITGQPFAQLPVFSDDKDRHLAAHIRQMLQDAIEDDLLGPAGGPEELLIAVTPRGRYLVGRLAPRDDVALNEDDLETADDAPQDLVPKEPKPLETKRTTKSYVDKDDPHEGEPEDERNNQSVVPSSLGLTCCLDGTATKLVIEASWGRYERGEDHVVPPDEEGGHTRTFPTWQRVPCGGRIEIAIPKGAGPLTAVPIKVDGHHEPIIIKGTIRAPLPNGDRLLTIFLINSQTKPEKNENTAWIFQPELRLCHPDGTAIFHRRPILGEGTQDSERIALEMIYRKQVEFAVGHNVSVTATPASDGVRASAVATQVVPAFEVPVTETPGADPRDRVKQREMLGKGFLDMRELAKAAPANLKAVLQAMIDDYGAWITEQEQRVGQTVIGYDQPAKDAMGRCKAIRSRLQAGLDILMGQDPNPLEAFRFANRVMAEQRIHSIWSLERRRKRDKAEPITAFDIPKNRSWRPFQLAFVLLSVPGLSDPLHSDRTDPIQGEADLLWFPTGGGKTEAYLGVAAFAMAIRRLKPDLGGLDGSRGLSVIMRYTLRLLTLQQFQRATTLICAMEMERRADNATWGTHPFTIGLWVGQSLTPNTTAQAAKAIADLNNGNRPSTSSPAQLTTCPWCGVEIIPGRDIDVDTGAFKTLTYCGDGDQLCPFSRKHAAGTGIPIQVVDEEMYRRPPTMMIATVDKFAMMAWRGEVRNLFGRVERECPKHGLGWPDSECEEKHGTKMVAVRRIRPPELIIQDEFHLISGPLGTMVGLYETAVDELCGWPLQGKIIHPKVIASTATVRKAAEQVRNVFLRKVAIFPPHGLDVEDNYFSVQRSRDEIPGRRYVGICSPGSARPSVLIRVYTAMLTASQAIFDRFGPLADPWFTTVGYFNSLRELGGMRRLAEDDVKTRCFRVKIRGNLVDQPGLSQRDLRNIDELTSRVSSREIPRKLDALEIRAKPKGTYGKDEDRAMDVVLATNMLSVGVDVNRLGLMAVNGQPKTTAEYIQATSRVGRAFPGLVVAVLTWSKPRDLSHYETFEHYHATFYKHVEAQSVTPFSVRAMDRGLTGTMISLLRLSQSTLNSNIGAERMQKAAGPDATATRALIVDRAGRVHNKHAGQEADRMTAARLDRWEAEATRGGRQLGYEKERGQGTVVPLLKTPGKDAWDIVTVPMSMREVEPGVRLQMLLTQPPEPPAWRIRPATTASAVIGWFSGSSGFGIPFGKLPSGA